MDNELNVLAMLLNGINGIVILYFIIAVPYRMFLRFRKIARNEYVMPATQVAIKILKSWMIAAPILMFISSIVTYISLRDVAGIDYEQLTQYIFAHSVIGNTLTSLMYAVVYTLYTTRKSF